MYKPTFPLSILLTNLYSRAILFSVDCWRNDVEGAPPNSIKRDNNVDLPLREKYENKLSNITEFGAPQNIKVESSKPAIDFVLFKSVEFSSKKF